MKKTNDKQTVKQLIDTILESILEKKGNRVIDMDLTNLKQTFSDHFIVCDAESTIQVAAIAENIERQVRENLKLKAWHREGYNNAQWILLDYLDVVVHVFQRPYREFYKLEELWADAEINYLKDVK